MWEREPILDGIECAGYEECCGFDTIVDVARGLERGRAPGTCDGREGARFLDDAKYCGESGDREDDCAGEF